MSNNADSVPKYQVLSLEKINKIEETKRYQTDTSYFVDYNNAYVIEYKDGSSIIRPSPLGGEQAIFFNSIVDMREMIKSRKYPVKDPDSFWFKEKERVLKFEESMPYYCAELSKLLDYKVEIRNDSIYLKDLSVVVNKRLTAKRPNALLFRYLEIYIGELLRKKVNAQWSLVPQTTLNVHYHPELTKGKTFCTHWGFVNRALKRADIFPVDIETLVESVNNFYDAGNRRYLRR